MKQARTGSLVALSALSLAGCVALSDDGSSGESLFVDVSLFWEEDPDNGFRFTCESAGVDLMSYRLRDARGDVLDCLPARPDGSCVIDPRRCGVEPCTEPPECFDVLPFDLEPGEYTLEVDGFSEGCAQPLWQVSCGGIFLDRFDEGYDCDVPIVANCEPPGGDADAGM